MTAQAILFNIQRFSTEDGPGIRTSLFFKGCPLDCPWCHNPEGMEPGARVVWQRVHCLDCGDCQEACPEEALLRHGDQPVIDRDTCVVCGTCVDECAAGALEVVGQSWTPEALLGEVLRDRTFYDKSGGGLTLTGGEPLTQHDFLTAFLPGVREAGVHVALDTSGVGSEAAWNAVLPLVDLVLFDLKVANPGAHRSLVGVHQEKVIEGLERVAESGLPVWVRTPVVPGATDGRDNVTELARLALEKVPGLQRYDLLAFSNLCGSKYEMLDRDFALADRALMRAEDMEELAAAARAVGVPDVHWSGPTRLDMEVDTSE